MPLTGSFSALPSWIAASFGAPPIAWAMSTLMAVAASSALPLMLVNVSRRFVDWAICSSPNSDLPAAAESDEA